MVNITKYTGRKSQLDAKVLKYVFLNIKAHVDNILSSFNNVDFLESPAVDVEAVAKKAGIRKIRYVPSEKIKGKLAILKRGKIFVNNDKLLTTESPFSIAHEIAHHVLKRKEVHILPMAFQEEINHTRINFDRVSIKYSTSDINSIAARTSNIELETVPDSMRKHSKQIAANASNLLGKHISEKDALTNYVDKFNEVVRTIQRLYNRDVKRKLIKPRNIYRAKTYKMLVKIYYEAVIETVKEEIADYFAANLLLPVERFVLWEDKSNREIADAFKVTEKCVEKRRAEIEHELKFLEPKNVLFEFSAEDMTPLSLDELKQLEGRSINETGRS